MSRPGAWPTGSAGGAYSWPAWAAVALAAFWARCLRHPSPVVDPALVKVRSFAMANTASMLFSASFAAMLLATVLFMTGVWHDSVLHAGLAIAPGPATAAVFATPAGRLARRFPQRLLAAFGIASFTCACLWWRLRVGVTPDYAGEMLPGLIASGVGVGFTLPTLAGASAASLPPARFATGSGIYSMARQLGLVLGVAIFVAVLGVVPAHNPLPSFDRGWTFMVVAGLLALAVALAIGQVRQPAVVAPAAAQPGAGGADARLALQEQGS